MSPEHRLMTGQRNAGNKKLARSKTERATCYSWEAFYWWRALL